MTSIDAAERAFTALGARQRRTRDAAVALGTLLRALELADADPREVAEFAQDARARVNAMLMGNWS